MVFWKGLIIGLFGGSIIGIFVMALCIAAKKDFLLDENDEQ